MAREKINPDRKNRLYAHPDFIKAFKKKAIDNDKSFVDFSLDVLKNPDLLREEPKKKGGFKNSFF